MQCRVLICNRIFERKGMNGDNGIFCIGTLGILVLVNSRRQPLNGYYLGARLLQFKEFELYWGAVFFLRFVHTFS